MNIALRRSTRPKTHETTFCSATIRRTLYLNLQALLHFLRLNGVMSIVVTEPT